MSTKSWGAALMVAGALFALSGCETPRPDDDLDTLRSQVTDLEARVSAAEASANQAATSADQCSQVCQRTESMFQQSLRK
jgi:outer membrane murein-binding lipoprotein Lpp